MTEEAPKENESSPKSGEQPLSLPPPEAEQKLEAAIKDLPPPQRERIRETVHEVFQSFMAIVQRGAGPSIDAETAKILADSADRENDRRFQYLSQKQKDEAAFRLTRHSDRNNLIWPILIAVLLVTIGCIITGIYLSATGHAILGASILTAVFAGLFGYLAGLGTANFFKDK